MGLCGVLLLDKPAGMTSFEVVKQVRRRLGVKKAGHTGTLDPLATGVLPLCLGEATRIAGLLLAEDKDYQAGVLLGVETDTLDMDGVVMRRSEPEGLDRAVVENALSGLRGPQQQVPPVYSAIRVGGKRAHALARAGEEPELAPRSVEVHQLELLSMDLPRLVLHISCSKGTYVRALVAELGRRLGCGAAVETLRRTRSGPFSLDQSLPLDRLEESLRDGTLPLLSMDEALSHLLAVEVDAEAARRLRMGQPQAAGPLTPGQLVRIREAGLLFAIGVERGGQLWPRRVLLPGAASC